MQTICSHCSVARETKLLPLELPIKMGFNGTTTWNDGKSRAFDLAWTTNTFTFKNVFFFYPQKPHIHNIILHMPNAFSWIQIVVFSWINKLMSIMIIEICTVSQKNKHANRRPKQFFLRSSHIDLFDMFRSIAHKKDAKNRSQSIGNSFSLPNFNRDRSFATLFDQLIRYCGSSYVHWTRLRQLIGILFRFGDESNTNSQQKKVKILVWNISQLEHIIATQQSKQKNIGVEHFLFAILQTQSFDGWNYWVLLFMFRTATRCDGGASWKRELGHTYKSTISNRHTEAYGIEVWNPEQ